METFFTFEDQMNLEKTTSFHSIPQQEYQQTNILAAVFSIQAFICLHFK